MGRPPEKEFTFEVRVVFFLSVICLVNGSTRKPVLQFNITTGANEETVTGQLVMYRTQSGHLSQSHAAAVNIEIKWSLPSFVVYESIESARGSLPPQSVQNGSTVTITFPRLNKTNTIDFELKTRVDPLRKLQTGQFHFVTAHAWMSYAGEYDTCHISGVSQPGMSAFETVQYTTYAPESCEQALVFGSGTFKPSQVTASSWRKQNDSDSWFSPQTARLRGNSSWLPSSSVKFDRNQFFQVDFRRKVKLMRIVTQGINLDGLPAFIKSYTLKYSDEGIHWADYIEDGLPKEFKANKDSIKVKPNRLQFPVETWFVRLIPVHWYREMALRLEVYGCRLASATSRALGMESGRIVNNRITASSSLHSVTFAAHNARLDTHLGNGGWCAGTQDANQYLQIDLGASYIVSQLASQPLSGSSLKSVVSYKLQHSLDTTTWTTYRQNGADKMFLGSPVDHLVVKQTLLVSITARYVRFKPNSFIGKMCMRVEVYGQVQSAGAKVFSPPFQRSVILDAANNTLYVCNAHTNRIRPSCFAGFNSGRSWKAMSFQVLSVLAYDASNSTLYGVYQRNGIYLQSIDPYGEEWIGISETTWESIRDDPKTTLATEVPVLPLMTDEPTQFMTFTDSSGSEWGVSSQGVHHKPSGGVRALVASWNEEDINQCGSAPCANGGDCTENSTSYVCDCRLGFNGTNCEQDIDDCSPNPCNNGGVCVDGVNRYTCTCSATFFGYNCDEFEDECLRIPCGNGGTCVDGIGNYTCQCPPGIMGFTCEINFDDCSSMPCVNDGVCVDGNNNYSCVCQDGYEGQQCQTKNRGFQVVSSAGATYNNVPFVVIKATIPASAQSMYSSWCEDYRRLCHTYGTRPVGCGYTFRNDSRYTSCRDKYSAVMLSNNLLGCASSTLAATVARQAGHATASDQNTFVLGACDIRCPNKLDNLVCPETLPCLQNGTSDNIVYTVCAYGDSNFRVSEERDFIHVNASYKFLKMSVVTSSSLHENWCRDYQKLCESHGLRPIGASKIYDYHVTLGTATPKLYQGVLPTDSSFGTSSRDKLYVLARLAGFPGAASHNTFAMFQTGHSSYCSKTITSACNQGLYCLDYRYRAELYTACTDGGSESSFKVLEARKVTYSTIPFLALQVKVPKGLKRNWCREYQGLCESYGSQPVGCSVVYQQYFEHARCRDEYRAMTSRSDVLGCPPYVTVAKVAQLAGFTKAVRGNSFAFSKCHQCGDFQDLPKSGCNSNRFPCLNENITDNIAFTLCAETESAFTILSSSKTTYQNLPYLVLHVRLPVSRQSKYNNWCTEYKELCSLYSRSPTGCGKSYTGSYSDCETTYSSLRPDNNDLSCNPSSYVYHMALNAGYSTASSSYSFAFHRCSSYCTNTLPSSGCYTSLYCLSTGHAKREAWTLCRGAEPVFNRILGVQETTYNNQKYTVFKLELPLNGMSRTENWCRDYQTLCQNHGLRPTGCGRRYLIDPQFRSCRDNYDSLMPDDDSLGCYSQYNVYLIAKSAGFSEAKSENCFAFGRCTNCSRWLPSSSCLKGMYCLKHNMESRIVYTVCRDPDSNFNIHESRKHTFRGTRFLVIKAEVHQSTNSKYVNWCMDYKKLCRSYGRLPTGTTAKYDAYGYQSTCRSSYGSVMLKDYLFDSDPQYQVLNIVKNSRIRTFYSVSNFAFHRCDSTSYCRKTLTTSCYAGPHCLKIANLRLVHTVCVDPDSSFQFIDAKTYTRLGRKFTVVHATIPADGVSKHETWCHDYHRLCRSFVVLPVTCGGEAWKSRDSYRCRDEYKAAVFDRNPLDCSSNHDAASIAQSAGFSTATVNNTITFHNCGACSKYLTSTPSKAVYPLTNSTLEIFALCTDSDSNFEVLDTRQGSYQGIPYTVIMARTPASGLSRHENWCRDYQRLCESYSQQPTGCGWQFHGSSNYVQCETSYNSSMPRHNNLGCNPSTAIQKAAYGISFIIASSANSFGFHTCNPSSCLNLLPISGTSSALYYSSRSSSYHQKHTVCVNRKPGFEYMSRLTYIMGDTKYLVIRARLPIDRTSKYENWCRDYEKLCEGFGMRPLACGTNARALYRFRSCQTEYSAVMPSDNYINCPPNLTRLADIAVKAGFTSATVTNVFAMRKCKDCSSTIPQYGNNFHLHNLNMQTPNREVYAFCMNSDSNFQVVSSKPVVYKSWKYLAVKVRVETNRRSQHENWCRDYQRMCESLGKRPLSCDARYSYQQDRFDCKTTYNAFLPKSNGYAWTCSPFGMVHNIVHQAGFYPSTSYQSFALYNCGSNCGKTLRSDTSCQNALHCLRWSSMSSYRYEAYTVCANPDSGFEVVDSKTITYGQTEYLVVMATVPLDGLSRHENWCRDYQRLCEAHGLRPLACGNRYRGVSQHSRCRDEYNGLMFYDDHSSCNQNEKVAAIAKNAGYVEANSNNSFAFHACEVSDCQMKLGRRSSRALYSAGVNQEDRTVFTVCVNSDSNFDVVYTRSRVYSSIEYLGVMAKLPLNGTSKYENWCRDYQRLCESYGKRPTGCGTSYLKATQYTSCRDNYRSLMPPTNVPGCAPSNGVYSIVHSLANSATTSNSFAFYKCLPNYCSKTLAQSSCDSSLYCSYQNVANKIVHTVCRESDTNFKVIDHQEVSYSNRKFLAIKATIKDTNATSKQSNWCLDYQKLCESYGKRPLVCSRAHAHVHHFSRCQETFNAVMMDLHECPLNTLIADIAVSAGFVRATASNSFAFHSCDESTCVRHLNDSGCDSALYCISRRVPDREVYTVCASSDTNFEVVSTYLSTYSSIQYMVIKARVPRHGKSFQENWCKDYQVLCESYGARPTGCGSSSMKKYEYGRCALKYRSHMPPGNNFGCTSNSYARSIASSAGYGDATLENTFVFNRCTDTACSSDLPTSGCHESLHCINSNLTDREVYTVCRLDYETNFKVLHTKDIVHRGVPYLVIKARLPTSRTSKKSTWCLEYQTLCNSYGQQPTGCGHAHAGVALYSSCASQFGSVMLPSNQLGCDPRVMVSVVARAAGFYNATRDNSFAFHRCGSGDCSNSLPTTGCSPSLSCAGMKATNLEVYTLCTKSSYSNFMVMDSNSVQHHGVRYIALKARIPTDGISLNENWCRDYQRMCDDFGGRPTGCGASNMSNPNCSMCNTEYGSVAPFGDLLGCGPTTTVAQVLNKAGFSSASGVNSFAFHQCDNQSCVRELPMKNCSNSLNCISRSVWAGEVYALCVDNNQPFNFEVIKTNETSHRAKLYIVFQARLPEGGRASNENWCRDYQLLCESFGLRPTGCGQGKQFEAGFLTCRERYNSLMLSDDSLECPAKRQVRDIAREAGFSSAEDHNTLAFEDCSPNQCPKVLNGTECEGSTKNFCNLRHASQRVIYTVCLRLNSSFEVMETKQATFDGLTYKVLMAKLSTSRVSVQENWCLEYQRVCESYGQRPVVQVHDSPEDGLTCRDEYNAVPVNWNSTNGIENLTTVAGFVNATKFNSFSFLKCSEQVCKTPFSASSCGGAFNCLPSLSDSVPEFVHVACLKDSPTSNFDVLSTKSIMHNQTPYLVIKARLPFHGQARYGDWCLDYQKLCENYALRPMACSRTNFDSDPEKAVCLAKYDAVMPRDSSLECPARSRVLNVAKAAGFEGAVTENSFALHNCMQCTRFLNGSENNGLYSISLNTFDREVYTVCTSDQSHNFEVLETRSTLYKDISFLVVRAKLPRFDGKSKQDSWCHDYQMLCESYGRRPVGSRADKFETSAYGECMTYFNAFIPVNDELTSDVPTGVKNIALQVGYWMATTTNSFAFGSCVSCSSHLPSSCDVNAGLYCLTDNFATDVFTVCV